MARWRIFSLDARRAFTRGELLVVIAIATLLLALLIPSLASIGGRARGSANLAVCKENLRQIGIALLAYSRDNAGAIPVAETVENPHVELVRTLIAPKYIVEPKCFYCPALEGTALAYSEENFRSGSIGYFYFCAADAPHDDRLSKFLRTELSWPRIISASSDGNMWVMSDIWLSGETTSHSSYKKGVNYLTLDGSVQFLSEGPRKQFH